MAARYKATCDQCRYRGLLDDVLRSYEFTEQVTLTIQRVAAWCPRCQGVAWSEMIPPLADINLRISEFERRDQTALDAVLPFVSRHSSLADLVASRLDDLRRRAAWVRGRQSPPRCLECGSTEIIPMTSGQTCSGNPKWTLSPHPNCGGTLTVLTEPILVLSRLWIRYTPEGNIIAKYEMSPSKGTVPIA